jgi:hypothetical protein
VTDSSRRDFLRAFGRRAARDAREVAVPVLRATSTLGTVNALRSLTGPGDTLAGLVRAEGLQARMGDLRGLASTAVRMAPVAEEPATAAAWLDLVGAEELLEPGAPMMLLAQVALSDPALEATWLHGAGWLVVFVDGAGTASVVRLDAPAALPPTAEAMALAAGPALPDVEDAAISALEFSDDERSAYIRIHDALAGDADHVLLGTPDAPAEDLGEGDWQALLQVRVGTAADVTVWVADGDLERAVARIG